MCRFEHRSDDRDDHHGHQGQRGHGPTEPTGAIRASDADRQAVIERLRAHTVDGRLSLDEFEVRVGEVLAAKTLADLAATMRELPEAQRARPTASPRPSTPSRSGGFSLPTPALVFLLVIAGSVLMRHFAFWLIPIGFCLFGPMGRGLANPRT